MASSTFEPKTPPLPATLMHTPSTPRFGTFDDDYQPYSPRKSSRISQRPRANQTPPPQSSSRNHRANPPSRASSTTPTKASGIRSPQTAPKKRGANNSAEIGGRRVSGALNYESTASAASALGLPTPTPRKTEKMTRGPVGAVRGNGMLPTPSKTPQKRPEDGQTAPEVAAIARNLFPVRTETVDEAMPSPKRKGKKRYTGFTLDSFGAEDEDSPIPIYTDSSERIPEADTSLDNPFYGSGAEQEPSPSKKSVKKKKVMVPGEGEQDLEDVQQRKDGVICVFRGRKVFKKFSDRLPATRGDTGSLADEIVGNEDDDELDSQLRAQGSTLQAPPEGSPSASRLLFPSERQLRSRTTRSQAVEEEEADTDIDESAISTPKGRSGKKPVALNGNSTPHYDNEVSTPMAPRFGPSAPISPPSTSRATRSKNVDTDSDEAYPNSPFHNWQTVKNPKKRSAEPAGRGGKRVKSTSEH
ncbi:hypothetical protein LSUE1_G007253 [Lachnellula suecica]|uniref:Uncharacterized protein n=1 Tax=Lachnellula suecica TaxID=602035 RepID=A0A8T9C075_9HELO|nr:hypothetical protein LSUE1_G007253 [Lachnellula suecica]